ncbi:hypothetical protein HK405_005309 [Cladochytrium tenue]|nr:hypothetical protein HK405_005309 [Cladochytrium tenue]
MADDLFGSVVQTLVSILVRLALNILITVGVIGIALLAWAYFGSGDEIAHTAATSMFHPAAKRMPPNSNVDGPGDIDDSASVDWSPDSNESLSQPNAVPSSRVVAVPSSVSSKRTRPVSAVISDVVSDAAVKTAMMLKQSSIPDTMASVTNASLTGYKRLDSAFNIQDRLVSAGQGLLRAGFTATGIAATAFIKAGVAYQTTPGYRELNQDIEEEDVAPSAAGEATEATGPAPTLRKKQSFRSIEGPIEVLRFCDVPGTFPLPTVTHRGTQTDAKITHTDPSVTAHEQPRTLRNHVSSPSLFSSVLWTSANVAAQVLTTSSNYVLGEETTKKLIGDDGLDSASVAVCMEGPVRNINVGGKYFATSVTTLRKVPGSRLARMFAPSGDHSDSPPPSFALSVANVVAQLSAQTQTSSDSKPLDPALIAEWKAAGIMTRDGCFFIDRDGTHFRHVLNHLRGLRLPKSFRSVDDLRALRTEAVYYDLVGLVVEIDERLTRIAAAGTDAASDGSDSEDCSAAATVAVLSGIEPAAPSAAFGAPQASRFDWGGWATMFASVAVFLASLYISHRVSDPIY